MNDVLTHRGPDDCGIYSSAGVTLGMRRLSIIDLETGHQPISNEGGDQWIVFNGEVYNHVELRRDLEARGHRFKTRSDTEVILHLFEEKGERTPAALRGDFAFAIWDETQQRGFLARDHVGVKPLYYVPLQERVLFSSELKALLQDDRVSLELSPEALDLYLAFLYVPAPWTIYKNIYKMPPGTYLEYEGGQHRLAPFWRPPVEQHSHWEEGDLRERIYQRLQEAVAVRLRSDVPLGVFLSGGLDSSAIVALASRSSPDPIKTFSIGYGEEFASFNELEYSRLVSRHYGTEHHEIVVEPSIQDTILQVVGSLDEPFGDSSAIPTYLVSQQTSDSVKVVLSGIGADELFGGYPRYLGALWESSYRHLPTRLRRVLGHLAQTIPEREVSRNVGGWMKSFLSHPEESPLDRYRRWVSFHSASERGDLYTPEFRVQLPRLDGDQSYFNRLAEPVGDWDLPDKALYLDLLSYLVNDLLFMADQIGMAHSLEIRVPFCDHLLLEDLLRYPSGCKIGRFSLKRLLKKVLEKDLPPQVLGRRKQGFMIPIGSWMRHQLRPLFSHYLDPERLRHQGIFKPERVDHWFKGHLSGKIRKTNQLWGLLVFQLWHERMEQKGP